MVTPTVQILEPEVRELIQEGRYLELRKSLAALEPVDVADLLEALDPDEAAVAFRLLRREDAADAFAELDSDVQEKLIEKLGEVRAVRLVEDMDPDDRVALLDELPAEVMTRLINSMSAENRRVTQTILGYPEESVGRLMTPDYVRVRPEWTVAHALEHIRRYGRDAETVHWVYVIDSKGRLVDDLHIRRLLLAEPETPIRDIMDDDFISLLATADQEEAVQMFNRYDRSAIPVVDSNGVLLGIVTYDDIADVAEEEVTEDIQKLGGMEALDEPYMQAGLFEMVRKRGIILCLLLVAQSITIGVLGLFEDHLAAASVLVLFIPLIIASGGNTGTQAASLLIRSLALGEVEPGDWFRVIRKELITGVLLGLSLAILAAGAVYVWDLLPQVDTEGMPLRVGATVGSAVLAIVLWGVTLGSMFPLILQKLKLDPATISSPLVATMMDVSGLLIYIAMAMLILL